MPCIGSEADMLTRMAEATLQENRITATPQRSDAI